MAKIKPIRFDYDGVLLPENGVTKAQIQQLTPSLEAARAEMLKTDLELYASCKDIPVDKQPLDAGFHELPERMLDVYQADRANSELGRMLTTAARLRDTVDKVVVLGMGATLGARALMESCCDPYHNELTRAQRGGRPRMYFEGNNVDNDWSQALIRFLQSDTSGDGPEGKWAIVVISKSGGTLETAAAFRQFLRELESAVGRDALPDLIVPVAGETGKLAGLADAIGVRDRFVVPAGVGGRFSVFSAAGVLPAAILGIDVVKLLEAAATMNNRFRIAAMGENPVMDYVAVNHLLEKEQNVGTRVLSVWSKSLEAAGLWYAQLLAESLGKTGQGTLPLTVLNSHGLHSRARQHQNGVRDKVINNLIVESWRSDPLPIGKINDGNWNQDQLNELADRTLPQLMTAAIDGTNQACQQGNCPTTRIVLPVADEGALGQLFQMLMLATVLEGRLLGINPYGQSGVETCQQNMNRLLRE